MEDRFFKIILRWLWLLILAPIMAGIAAFLFTNSLPPTYEAQALVIVGPGIDSLNPDRDAFQASAILMQTYAELATTNSFLSEIISDLDLDMTALELGSALSVVPKTDTQILRITAQDKDANRTMLIANTVAQKLVDLSVSSDMGDIESFYAPMRRQAASLEEDIILTEQRIDDLETQLAETFEVERQKVLIDLISEEHRRLSDANDTLAQLYQVFQQPITNQVKMLDRAVSATPIRSQMVLNVIVAAVAGLVLSSLSVLAMDLLEDTFVNEDNISEVTDISVLGSVEVSDTSGTLIVQNDPKSKAAERYRVLGAKLMFQHETRKVQTILLSGVTTNAGLGEVVANLAATLTQMGMRVLLIDADLYQVNLENVFRVDSSSGLGNALTAEGWASTPIPDVPGLSFLPSGPVSANSLALLASPQMVQLLDQFRNYADIVLLLGPPVLAHVDNLFYASRVDNFVLVAETGQTRRVDLEEVLSRIASVGASAAGFVFTKGAK